MTREECYEQILQLTSELKNTNVAAEVFEAAKNGTPSEVEDVFDAFKILHSKLYESIVNFGEKYNTTTEKLNVWGVFGAKDDTEKGVHIFEPEKIDAPSFCVLIYMANIDELFLFEDDFEDSSDLFLTALENEGHKYLAEFIANASWVDYVGEDEQYETVYQLLVAIFEGRFELCF